MICEHFYLWGCVLLEEVKWEKKSLPVTKQEMIVCFDCLDCPRIVQTR